MTDPGRMTLYWSPRSPFVRKVMVVAHEVGLADLIDLAPTVVRMAQSHETLISFNPMGKIPSLRLADGSLVFDSIVIAEYLNTLGGGSLFPEGQARWPALTLEAVANALLDILVLWRNERDKPAERQTAEWVAAFTRKTEATLGYFEQIAPRLGQEAFNIAHVSIGCGLSYLDFRFPALGWRKGRPNLAAWHEMFCTRASARASVIKDN
ncbi:MAG: glutathione S-transferase family protein [Acetobacteraceae bacterium]